MDTKTEMEREIDASLAVLAAKAELELAAQVAADAELEVAAAAALAASVVMIGKYKVTVPPGRLLVLKVATDETTEGGTVIPAMAQDQHGQKLGIHMPMGGVLAVGPIDPGVPQDAERFKFTVVDDVVWYDYRQAGEITLAGKNYYLVPRQAVIGKVELGVVLA